MHFPNTLCLSTVAALALAGCASTGTTSTPEAPAVTAEAQDPLAAWLAQAPKPAAVACSVEKADAPEAVARFDALSAEIASLYDRVYADAQKVSAAAPTELAFSAEELGSLGDAAEWKTAAQSAVTAHYQATLREIETQRKALTAYTESLRADNAISNITSRLRQTALLVKMGDDSRKLGSQLLKTEEGARLVLKRRIAATLGK